MISEAPSVDVRRREVFEELQRLARADADQGRTSYAASTKPQLQKRVAGFAEGDLGFQSFREFLQAAEQAGYVRLVLARGGDVEILPPELALPTGSVRIRRDFWTALMTEEGRPYCYLPASDQVLRLVDTAGQKVGDRSVPLPVVSQETHEAWLNEFVGGMDDPDRESIQAKLAVHPELGDRMRVITENPVSRQQWYAARTKRVMDLLTAWSKEHGLDVDFVEAPTRVREKEKPTGGRPAPQRRVARRDREEQLRSRVHAAVDRMPLSDLLRLSLPVEYTIEH